MSKRSKRKHKPHMRGSPLRTMAYVHYEKESAERNLNFARKFPQLAPKLVGRVREHLKRGGLRTEDIGTTHRELKKLAGEI